MSGFNTLAGYLVRVNRWCSLIKVRQHLYWTDDIWCFLKATDKVWTLWDLLNVDYTGLDLISSIKSLFPHFNVNSKSLVSEKQHDLDHVAVEMDVTTSVTAVQLPPAVWHRQPHKLKNMNVNLQHHFLGQKNQASVYCEVGSNWLNL